MLKEANGWKGDMIIDATGTKYIVKCSYMTKWKGIHGFTGMIYYEQEYEDNPESFSLQQLQDRIAERYPKTRWFREEGWGSRDDFRRTVYACKTFEELAGLFRHPPETLRTRIASYPERAENENRNFIVPYPVPVSVLSDIRIQYQQLKLLPIKVLSLLHEKVSHCRMWTTCRNRCGCSCQRLISRL